jgi:toxin ParE1/3/4
MIPPSRTVTAREIYERAGALKTFPHRGRQGRVKGTRELPLPPLPFIVVYRTLSNAVEIANIIHGAQRWP